MEYCFNCGARLIEKNQKFCIECGIKLIERGKEYRKDQNPKDGESYTDYQSRINSPIKDKIASDEEIEAESLAYRDYDPLKSYKENKINYPKSEMEDELILEEENSSPVFNEEPNSSTRDILSEGMFGKPALSIEGNFVYEGIYGRPKYYIDGDIIREDNQFGEPAFKIDGNYIREGMFGKPKYYIDGDLIRENNRLGKVVARRK